jgi:ABC-2 type transport system ATP-binding protein
MAEAEALSDRLTVLLGGKVAAQGTPRELTRQGERRTRIAVKTENGSEALLELAKATRQPASDGYTVWLSEDPEASLRALLDEAGRAGDHLVDLRVERPTLEERFLELTRKEAA